MDVKEPFGRFLARGLQREIHFSGSLVIECLMWALMIIKLEIAGQALACLPW